MPSPTQDEIERLKSQLWEKLDTLPQRDLIARSDADQWINYMANVMPREAMWHMIRAGGVGGSEIGGLVRNYLGHRADHEFSAHDWALGKLLRSTPTIGTGVLLRGHQMEPIHAKRFYEEYGTKRDVDAYNKLANAKSRYTWMRYSPDDMVFFHNPTSFELPDGNVIEVKNRLLVDYKAPSTVDANPRISFQYSCQLHQGALLCEENGIELFGTMLSQFDWATWSLKNDFVEINPELCDLVKEAGEHYWGFVMRGEIPPYINRKRLEINPSLRDRWEDVARTLAQMKAMTTAIEKGAEQLRENLLIGLGLNDQRLDGQSVSFPDAMNITASTSINEDAVYEVLEPEEIEPLLVKEKTTKYDADAMVAFLKAQGVDVKQFRKQTKIDPALAFEYLAQRGEDPEKFIKETLRINVAPAMKERVQDWYQEGFGDVQLPDVTEDLMRSADDDEIERRQAQPAGQRNGTN